MLSLPLQLLLLTVAGWMTRDAQRVTECLLAENAVLREQLRRRRIGYTDAQRRRLATAAKKPGRRALRHVDVAYPNLIRPAQFRAAELYASVGWRALSSVLGVSG